MNHILDDEKYTDYLIWSRQDIAKEISEMLFLITGQLEKATKPLKLITTHTITEKLIQNQDRLEELLVEYRSVCSELEEMERVRRLD